MPEIVYLLVPQRSSDTHQIGVEITHDISQVQELLDHASKTACQLLDSAPAVTVKAYKLLNPVPWYNRQCDDIAAEIGPIDNDFFRQKSFSPII